MLKKQHNNSMNQFNLGNFLNKFINNYSASGMNKGDAPHNPALPPEVGMPQNAMLQETAHKVVQNTSLNSFNSTMMANFRMNNLASIEKSLYLKDLMNFPKEMEEILVLIQNKISTTEEVAKLLNTRINIASLAELIQKSGKEAMNKLVLVMSNAAKQGITDTSQIKDAIRLINASVSVAGQDNPNQILKSFMLLYLPWLPLQEGVDFDLEIEGSEAGEKGDESSIIIMISTINFGNIKIVIVLLGGNLINIFVSCSDKFPKEDLLKRVKAEGKSHSIQTEMNFEQKEIKRGENPSRQAKVSVSNLVEVNPFLLLMANALIRNTIDLDNLAG